MKYKRRKIPSFLSEKYVGFSFNRIPRVQRSGVQPDPAHIQLTTPTSPLPAQSVLLWLGKKIIKTLKSPSKVFSVVLRGQEQPGTAAGSSLSSFPARGMPSSGCRWEIPDPGNANQTGARGQPTNLPNSTQNEALCSPCHLLGLIRILLIVTESQNGFSWKGH